MAVPAIADLAFLLENQHWDQPENQNLTLRKSASQERRTWEEGTTGASGGPSSNLHSAASQLADLGRFLSFVSQFPAGKHTCTACITETVLWFSSTHLLYPYCIRLLGLP